MGWSNPCFMVGDLSRECKKSGAHFASPGELSAERRLKWLFRTRIFLIRGWESVSIVPILVGWSFVTSQRLTRMHLPENLKRDPFVGHLLGSIAEVYSNLGPGLLVDAYREALTLEISSKGLPFQVKPRVQAYYLARPIEGYFFIPDMTIANRFIIEVKTADSRRATDIRRYLKTYLTMSQFKQGFILNFDAATLASVAEYLCFESSELIPR